MKLSVMRFIYTEMEKVLKGTYIQTLNFNDCKIFNALLIYYVYVSYLATYNVCGFATNNLEEDT